MDELSNWYVRCSRDRFWATDLPQDTVNAFMTLYTALVTISKAAAPMVPFITESIYQNLVRNIYPDAPESIHLCDFPKYDESIIDANIEKSMDEAIKIVECARAARNNAGINNRQPLGTMYVKADFALDSTFADIVKGELNIKNIEFVDDLSNFMSYSFKPQLRTLGRRFGKNINAVKEILASIDGQKAMADLKSAGKITITVDGRDEDLSEEDLLIEPMQAEGFENMTSSGVTTVLDIKLSDELIEEGFVREIISKVQNMRKDDDFEVMDHINIYCENSGKIADILKANADTVKTETLCVNIITDKKPEGFVKEWNINGEKAILGVEKINE